MSILDPETLLNAYSTGIFPMSKSRHDPEVEWFTATRRGVIPMESFHMSNNVLKIIKQARFRIFVNTGFRQVVEKCADRPETWINDVIIDSYCKLHEMGFAHSIEVYERKRLVGGLYGVTLGAAFFGESMFHLVPEADKVALQFCFLALKNGGFQLWDTQMWTPHLARFGCVEIDPEEYERQLRLATAAESCLFELPKNPD